MLDVACGTGGHLRYLREEFSCEGVDFERGLLEVDRASLPGIRFSQGDMTDFSLGRRFDVVTCLYSAIDYVRTVDRMRASMRCLTGHLEPGGVLLAEPWIQPDSIVDEEEKWVDGSSEVVVMEDDDMKLVRVRIFRRRGTMSELEMHYVTACDGEIVAKTELHRVAIPVRTSTPVPEEDDVELMEMTMGAEVHVSLSY